MTRIREEDDSDLATLRAALEEWDRAFGSTPRTAGEAVLAAANDVALRDALTALAGGERLDSGQLGYALRRVRGRPVAGLMFERAPVKRGASQWTAKSIEGRS